MALHFPYIDNFDHAVPDHEPALTATDLSHLVLEESFPSIVLDKLHGREHLLQVSPS